MRKPRLFLLLSEIWSMTDARDLARVVELAVEAEKAGFDGVMIGEHIVLTPSAAADGVPANPREWLRSGNQPPMYSHPSSLHLLAAIAARTTTLRLLAASLLSPLRHPLTIAKEMATVDLISRGRLIVMPGVGGHRDEYRVLGVPAEKRGKILDEQLEIWERLWTKGSPVSYDGEIFQLDGAYVEPQPWRAGGPPVWFGAVGLKPYHIPRIVRYGKGYWPVLPPKPEDMDKLGAAMAAAGRNMDELEIGTLLLGRPFKGPDDLLDLDETLEPVPELYSRGVTNFLVKPSLFIDDDAGLGDLCRAAVAKVDALTR